MCCILLTILIIINTMQKNKGKIKSRPRTYTHPPTSLKCKRDKKSFGCGLCPSTLYNLLDRWIDTVYKHISGHLQTKKNNLIDVFKEI